MSHLARRKWLALAFAASATAGLTVIAQVAPGDASRRVLAQPTAAPAIDTGELTVRHRRAAPRVVDAAGADAAETTTAARASWPYEPGKVIVRFRGGVAGARDASMRAVGATGLYTPSHANFEIMRIDPEADAEAVAAELMQRPDVEYAQAAYRVYPYFTPNDPLYTNQWNFSAIGMEQAWDINQGASNAIVVAVLDTGVAYENATFDFVGVPFEVDGVRFPALGRVSVPFALAPELGPASRFVAPRDFIWNDDDPVDLDGHGTHVAGTIGQATNNGVGVAGMAFNVKIMPVKCIASTWDDAFDSPAIGTDDVIARAIRYAADNGAKVINMSLGRSGGPEAPLIGEAIRYAVGRGAFVAVAAGNDYERGNPVERLAEQAAPIEGAMAVAAVGRGLTRAYYSGVKPYVEIAAPGGDHRAAGSSSGAILQQTYSPIFTDTFTGGPLRYAAPRFDTFAYVYYQGTSMATPHVSGLAALLMSQGITSPQAVEAAIKRFATDKGAPGVDQEYGAGLINPRNTLRGLGLIK